MNRRVALGMAGTGVVCAGLLFFICAGLFTSTTATLVHVGAGETLGDVAQNLQTARIINSKTLFEVLVRLRGKDTGVVAGEYFFAEPQSVFTVATRIVRGDFNLKPVRVVVPEGTTAKEIATLLARVPGVNPATFLERALEKEGYLFPDTYFVYPGEDTDTLLKRFETNFNQHIQEASLQNAVASFGKPLASVVTMASLLEKEAPDAANRRIIAGILWKRLHIGMPLQVDAVFAYITGKTPGDISHADLANKSLYNTYLYKGLPPGPIGNPGVDSLLAAVTPTDTKFLYYLSDKNGVFHYSATYAGQVANQTKYLR
ncbi:MAG: endolytic transglycosylase MltG [Candidatus Adlerbacteria bacterium]